MPLGANAGYKLFNTGDVLTAAQVQNNLQNQSIMFFASAAARDASAPLTAALTEGMFCYLADTNAVEFYTGAAWTAFATGDITGLTAGTGITIANASGPVPTISVSTNATLTSPKETIEIVADEKKPETESNNQQETDDLKRSLNESEAETENKKFKIVRSE